MEETETEGGRKGGTGRDREGRRDSEEDVSCMNENFPCILMYEYDIGARGVSASSNRG